MELMRNRDTALQPDEKLQRALNGDREALGSLFASHMPKLYRAALRIVGTPEDAEEALQDGLLCAIRHLDKFERRSLFSTWLTRIVINSALMRLRKNHREVLTSFDQNRDRDETALAVPLTDPRPNPEEVCEWRERFQLFERELRRLPAPFRSILWMRDVQGMSTREAAETLGVKPTTVKSQLFRARLKLGREAAWQALSAETLKPPRAKLRGQTNGLPPDCWWNLRVGPFQGIEGMYKEP